MDQLATCDFLLMIHSNRGPISYHFRDKRQFMSKVANFFHISVYLMLPLSEFPLEICNGGSAQKRSHASTR